MKKLCYVAAVLFCAAFTTTACLDSDDNRSEATIDYMGALSSIAWTDSADTAFTPLVVESLAKLEAIGAGSYFSETASIDYSNMGVVYGLCNSQAIERFGKRLNQLDMDKVKSAIYAAHSDSLHNVGYATASDIPLHTFTAHIDLYASLYSQPVDTFQVRFTTH